MQIAYRLAHRVGQKTVYGIDEQSDTIDYFPFDKVQAYAKTHHQTAALDRMQEKVEKKVKAEEAAQKTTPIRLLLAQMNEPAQARADHDEFYDGLLALGDQKEVAANRLASHLNLHLESRWPAMARAMT